MMVHQFLHPKTYSSSRERNTNQTDVHRDENFGSWFSPVERGCTAVVVVVVVVVGGSWVYPSYFLFSHGNVTQWDIRDIKHVQDTKNKKMHDLP
jgi:MoaA/NifB/PqqE/SkfB family radical SAM enzyme